MDDTRSFTPAAATVSKGRKLCHMLPCVCVYEFTKASIGCPWELRSATCYTADVWLVLADQPHVRDAHDPIDSELYVVSVTEGPYTDLLAPDIVRTKQHGESLHFHRRELIALLLRALSAGHGVRVLSDQRRFNRGK